MRDTESHCPLKETLGMQLKNVRNATTMTTVSPYGDLSLLHAKVGEFIGAVEPAYAHSTNNPLLDILIEQATEYLYTVPIDYPESRPIVNSRDSKLQYLFAKLTMLRAKDPEEDPDHMIRVHKASLAISMELQRRMKVDHIFEEFLAKGRAPTDEEFDSDEIFDDSAYA